MIQLRVKKDQSSYSYNLDYSEYWEAETEEDLITEYSDHLFEHNRPSVDQIVDVFRVPNNEKNIRAYSTGEKWELMDRINYRLETLHSEYIEYRNQQDEMYQDYKDAVLPY